VSGKSYVVSSYDFGQRNSYKTAQELGLNFG